jgi:hypothetical protein
VLPTVKTGLKPTLVETVSTPSDAKKSTKKSTEKVQLHGNVNFVCSDIDTANSTVIFIFSKNFRE